MKDSLVSEYRKIVTTRTWWVLLIVMVGYMAFMGAAMAFAFSFDGAEVTGASGEAVPMDTTTAATTVYTLPSTFGYALPLLVGLLSVTSEFRHRTLTPTLLAQPDRNRFVVSKLVASIPMGVLYGVLGTLATVGAGALAFVVNDTATGLDDGAVWGVIARTALALTVWCVVGVGLGFAMPNQVVAIVVVLAFTQFVEPIARLVLGLNDALAPAGKFLPGAAGEAISGGSFYSATGAGDLLGPAAGAAVLVGYAVVLALLGRFTTLKRDIT
ncbi:ABC transporter permease [Cellulomonas pakistanensis]|uniref:ABC transporter permease n=1 Tax=Cellulomonas pakistanensis TaxID=992287 RepID=A0A919PC11_9CELL|nr:ABC transporter permease [Cellulomonas pakistanensis]GIG36154.1 ABC transporter permease [Cellulomonas pakistanensis]